MTSTKTPNWYPGPTIATDESPTGFGEYMYDLNIPADRAEWEAAWAKWAGLPVPSRQIIDEKGRPTGEVEIDPERKARMNEALAYCAAYTGNWGLILDIRADRRWGTKYMRLSDRQVEVILNAKTRDAERAAVAPTHTRYAEAIEFAKTHAAGNGFFTSLVEQAGRRTLSDKQVDAILRNMPVKVEGKVQVEVSEGWYMVEGTPFKVQHNLQHTNLYAKRLTQEGWEYVQGGVRLIAQKGEAMTREAAAEYGKLFSVCAVCGRELTNEESITIGVGPVCLGRLA